MAELEIAATVSETAGEGEVARSELLARIAALPPTEKRFHGTMVSLDWFPSSMVYSSCSDKFGSMSLPMTRKVFCRSRRYAGRLTGIRWAIANDFLPGFAGHAR